MRNKSKSTTSSEILTRASLSKDTILYDVHDLRTNSTLEQCKKWIDDAYNKGIDAIGIIHGHPCKENCRKLGALYNFLRNNDNVDGIYGPHWNSGAVYISLKRK